MNDPNLREHSRDLPTGLSHRPRDGSVVSSLHCMNDPQPEGHMASYIGRRKFLATLGGVASWPLAARAQEPERLRRVGMLIGYAEEDHEVRARVSPFEQALQELGWTRGRNIQFTYRWERGDVERLRVYAAELIGLAPDVLLTATTSAVAALRRETRTVPIVFVNVTDPVGSGF